jgi:UDP-glucose 4-epimerase
VGTGKGTKIKDLAQMMIRILNLNLKPVFTEPRPGDIIYSVSDTNRLRDYLGIEPSDELEGYLRKMICIPKKRNAL